MHRISILRSPFQRPTAPNLPKHSCPVPFNLCRPHRHLNLMPPPSPRKSDATKDSRCAALDSFRNVCRIPTQEGVKWCGRHDAVSTLFTDSKSSSILNIIQRVIGEEKVVHWIQGSPCRTQRISKIHNLPQFEVSQELHFVRRRQRMEPGVEREIQPFESVRFLSGRVIFHVN